MIISTWGHNYKAWKYLNRKLKGFQHSRIPGPHFTNLLQWSHSLVAKDRKQWCVGDWLVCRSRGSCTEGVLASGGHHSGHFGAPHAHHRWRCAMLRSHGPDDIPISSDWRSFAQWLSPRQTKLVVLQGWKSLVHFRFCSPDRVTAFVPYRPRRDILASSASH